jgi:hypothetical protein
MKRALSATAIIGVLVLLVTTGASDGISAKEDVSIAVVGDQRVVGKPFAVRIRKWRQAAYHLPRPCGAIVVAGSGRPAPAFAVQARKGKNGAERR